MATYQYRTWTGDGGTRSNTRTFYPGQSGYNRALRQANRSGQGGTASSGG